MRFHAPGQVGFEISGLAKGQQPERGLSIPPQLSNIPGFCDVFYIGFQFTLQRTGKSDWKVRAPTERAILRDTAGKPPRPRTVVEIRGGWSGTPDAPSAYATNGGVLKQADKHQHA